MPDMTMTPAIREMRQRVRAFMDEHIYPNEETLSEPNGNSDLVLGQVKTLLKPLETNGIGFALTVGVGRLNPGTAQVSLELLSLQDRGGLRQRDE